MGKVVAGEREKSVRTSGIPGFVAYDETSIDLVRNIVEFREDCIRNPICMAVDAHEQDRATAKRFTLNIILLRPAPDTNQMRGDS